MAINQIMDSKKQRDAIHEAIKRLAKVTGCGDSKEDGSEFARIMLPAISEAAYNGGDILNEIANKLLTFRPRRREENGPHSDVSVQV
jgi:hypothetical protein